MKLRTIARELRIHAPFTAFGTVTGTVIMALVIHVRLPREASSILFWTFHPLHVVSSALVTEPTPFGLNDLKLAVEMVRALKLPFAVVINQADVGDGDTKAYCARQRIEVLAEVPDDRQLAEAYSRGEMACDVTPKYRELYSDLLNSLAKRVPAYAG